MATVLSTHGLPSGAEPQAASSSTPKALWITVGVLAVAVAALAGALVTKSMSSQPAPAPVQQASALPKVAPADGTPVNDKPMQLQAQPQAQTAQSTAPAPKPAPVKKPAPKPAPAAQPAPQQVAQAPARAICTTCGTVVSVQPVTVKGEGSGVGVVGGAVAGGLLGSQIGGGNGKKAMTVVGAIGGALAGNEVEKRVRSSTVYDVQVRMEDGSVRTVRQAEPMNAGTRVHVDSSGLRVAGN
jgi:outer membrane lipoprotein SlyB